ncbi:interleukin-1 receptor type 2 [Pseudoliparis swirei]|uniref:interleukin-1 receptor type 2 n=1 Tax=Pseudoliparis swirei TaxID=2059687 RepID=UPI0024BEDAD0|nr:interleukin-1 receptor type 2 [Pseudoliparis swirei]
MYGRPIKITSVLSEFNIKKLRVIGLLTSRKQSVCVSGSIRLRVLESRSVDKEQLSYPVGVVVGERLRLPCPLVRDFNHTELTWSKDPGLPPSSAGSFLQAGGRLLIPAVRRAHAGAYTCRLRAHIDERQYEVSRSVTLEVEGDDPLTTSVADLSVTSDPELSNFLVIKPPVILSPRNGDVFESPHGSDLELSCTVLAECHMVDDTVVTWLANNQSVESSYLHGRALQGGRRVMSVSGGCLIESRLAVVMVTEEDEQAQLSCVAQSAGGRQEVVTRLQLQGSTSTWLQVSAVAASCFLSVVCLFLFLLFKARGRKTPEYFLAPQSFT